MGGQNWTPIDSYRPIAVSGSIIEVSTATAVKEAGRDEDNPLGT